MKILPITTMQNPAVQNRKNKNTNSNINFGVKLLVHENVPEFIMKEAGNKAVKKGINPYFAMDQAYDVLAQNIRTLTEKVKALAPSELPIVLSLTPEAQEYAAVPNINGQFFEGEGKSLQISAPSPFNGYVAKAIDFFDPNPESMKKLEDEIGTFAKVLSPYYKS